MKDRAGLNMILDGERTGRLTHERTLLDATSGNTGIAYAMICALKGYKVKLCLPANASHERKQILKGLRRGDGFFRSRRRLGWRDPSCAARCTKPIRTRIFIPISTTIPPTGRRISTAPRSRLSSRPPAPSRTSSPAWAPAERSRETARRLKRDMPGVTCISAQPSSGFHGLEGLKHMPTAIVPGIYDPSLADDNLWIETEDAYRMTRWLGRQRGPAGGHVLRRQRPRGARSGPAAGQGRPHGRDRHDAVRRRNQISQRAILG